MKKLKELSLEELRKLYRENSDFQNALDEGLYEGLSFQAKDEYSIFFTKDAKGFRYNDNYSSFYYTLTDAEAFVNGLNDDLDDYFDKETLPVYKKMKKLADKYWNMDYDEQLDEKGEKVYEELEEACKIVLSFIEKQLHCFEEITDDLLDSELEYIMSGDSYMSDYETDMEKIYFTKAIVWK